MPSTAPSADTPTSTSPSNYLRGVSLVALGLAIALWGLGSKSLWSDEIVTAQLTRQPFRPMWQAMHTDPNHLPLYFLLQWAFSWLGRSEWAIRLVSAFLATATVAAVYVMGRELLNEHAAVAAACALATHSYHIWAAQEARYYALIGFLAALSVTALLRLLHKPERTSVVVFVLATAAAGFTHFFCLFMIAAEGLATLLTLALPSKRSQTPRKTLLLAWATLGVLYLPLLPYLLRLLRTEQGGATPLLTMDMIRSLWLTYGGHSKTTAVAYSGAALLGLVILIRTRPDAARLALCLVLPLPILALLKTNHFFLPKYLHYMFPTYVALAAVGLAFTINRVLPRLNAIGTSLILVVIIVAGNYNGLSAYAQSEKFNWRDAAAYVAERAGPEDAVIVLPPAWPEIQWYFLPNSRTSSVVPFGYGRQSVSALMSAAARARDLYWLVLIPPGHVPSEHDLTAAFDVKPFYGVLALKMRAPATQAATTILPVFAAACGGDAVLAGPAWDTLGAILEGLGEQNKAITAYQAALARFREPRVRSRLQADIARLRGDWRTAASLYEEATEPAPDLPEVYVHLGDARYALGDYAGAMAAYLDYWHLTGSVPEQVRIEADLLAELPNARVKTPGEPIDTPYCDGVSASSCYVSRDIFTIPSTGETRDVLFAHPISLVQFTLQLSSDRTFFICSPILDPRSWKWGGDGVTFRVTAAAAGEDPPPLHEEHITTERTQWLDWIIPLDRWRGRSLLLTLETGPGPANNFSGDWAGWGQPLVVSLSNGIP